MRKTNKDETEKKIVDKNANRSLRFISDNEWLPVRREPCHTGVGGRFRRLIRIFRRRPVFKRATCWGLRSPPLTQKTVESSDGGRPSYNTNSGFESEIVKKPLPGVYTAPAHNTSCTSAPASTPAPLFFWQSNSSCRLTALRCNSSGGQNNSTGNNYQQPP